MLLLTVASKVEVLHAWTSAIEPHWMVPACALHNKLLGQETTGIAFQTLVRRHSIIPSHHVQYQRMIHLYVEHLLNIRTLSIQANLTTVSNKETNATLSADGKILSLTHEGESASITLPIVLSPSRASTVTLTIPAVPSKTLTFRVQLEEKESQLNGNTPLNNASADQANVIPWMSDSLGVETQILCRECRTVLVGKDIPRIWKDLPSEGWAEMMEFWHCHKPHEPHDAGSHVKKGYAADAKVALDVGVGMVDPLDVLLAPGDCSNVEVSLHFFLSWIFTLACFSHTPGQ